MLGMSTELGEQGQTEKPESRRQGPEQICRSKVEDENEYMATADIGAVG